jgi:hypothetical protein
MQQCIECEVSLLHTLNLFLMYCLGQAVASYIAKHSVLAASFNMPVYLQLGKVNGKDKGALGHTMKACGGSGGIAPLILNLSTKCTSGQFHTLAAFLQEKSPWCPVNRRLGGPQIQSGHFENKETICVLRIKPRFLSYPIHTLVTTSTVLPVHQH